MSLSRPLIALVGVGVLGIAAVGVGVGATFTDATHSLQTINTGSIDMTLSSDYAGVTTSADGKTLTLPASGLYGSTFKTALVPITMTNNGTSTAKRTSIDVSTTLKTGSLADGELRDQMYVCIVSPADNTGKVIYDGLVKNVGLRTLTGGILPKATDTYSAEFYAGQQATACTGKDGAVTPVLTGLDNKAQGGSVTPSVTVNFEQ